MLDLGMTEPFDFAGWMRVTGLSQAEAAKELGLNPRYVSMLVCRGTRRPSEALMQRCIAVAKSRIVGIEGWLKDEERRYLSIRNIPPRD